jgi:hypothetical protein
MNWDTITLVNSEAQLKVRRCRKAVFDITQTAGKKAPHPPLSVLIFSIFWVRFHDNNWVKLRMKRYNRADSLGKRP